MKTPIKLTKPRLAALSLAHGAHPDRSNGLCVMEVSAWLAGEPHSDSPACVCPVIAAFLRRWNDDLDDATRQRLKPYAKRVLNTKRTPAVESARAWLVTDWMVRAYTPAWLDLAGCGEQAAALRGLPAITKATVAKSAAPLDDARSKASAAWAAARAAAWAAAWDAAWAAAGDAAWDAARAAAWAAAWAAARDAAGAAARAAARAAAGAAAWDAARAAARDAARDAAGKALAPTVTSLQASAFDLLDRMIALDAAEEAGR